MKQNTAEITRQISLRPKEFNGFLHRSYHPWSGDCERWKSMSVIYISHVISAMETLLCYSCVAKLYTCGSSYNSFMHFEL